MVALHCDSALSFDVYVYASNKTKPDFEKLGVKNSLLLYEQKFYKIKINNLDPIKPSDFNSVLREIKSFNGDIVQIDIETWLGSGPNAGSEYIDRYAALVTDLKLQFLNKQFGFYDVVPAWAHWNITTNPLWKADWLLENRRRQKIADAEDILYPCMYTYHDNYEDWEARSDLILKEARRMAKGKPVVPFLWPRFHQSSINKENAVKFIPREYWKKQLEYVLKNADGVVVWNDDQYDKWDNSSPWWMEVQQIIKENIKQ